MTITIAFNMMLIGSGPLSGPAHYAVHLFEALADLAGEDGSGFALAGYIREGGEKHFRPELHRHLRPQRAPGTRAPRLLFEQLVLPFRLRRDQVDILVNPAFTGPLWGARRIVTVVPDVYFRAVPGLLEPRQRRFLATMVPICCRRSWRVLTISQRTADDLVAYYPGLKGKVFVTLLGSKFGSAPHRERTGKTAADSYLLLVANLTANKNPAVVVEAIATARAQGWPLRLVHVGRDQLGLLADAIAAHDAESWVQLERDISDERLASLYQGALALVIPSFYEGFGMPVLEGQSLGVPVISSDRGSLPEVAGEGALYFRPDDADQLLGHARALAAEPDRRSALIARGYENVARFSWQRTAAQTLALLLPEAVRRDASPDPA